MDWFEKALEVFTVEKPEHFGNYQHCDECEEHDATLRNSDVYSIGLDELGSAESDPICFCESEGKIYYMPAMIKLAVESMNDDFYLSQLLFHLEGDGKYNKLYQPCNSEQRKFVTAFIDWAILNHSERLEDQIYEHVAFRVHDIWSNT